MQQKSSHPWVIWALVVVFYFYQYFLRICPSVFVDELISDFHLDATGVGTLSSFYFYIYAILQIPVGLLLDKLGSKWLLSGAALLCSIGTLIFGLSTSIYLADLGRFLQGAGSAFAFIGMIYVSAHYFPASTLGLLICLGDSLGKLGAVVGTGPFSNLLEYISWQSAHVYFGIFGLIVSCILFFSIKEPKQECALPISLKEQLFTFIKERQTWLIVSVSSLLVVMTTSFAGLWGAPFLYTAYHMSKEVASYAISIFFLGSLLGAPVSGYLSDKIRKRVPFLLISGLACAFLIYIIVYKISLSHFYVFLLLFFLGLFSSIQNLTYCLVIEKNPPRFKGAATGYINFFVFLTGAITQPLIGYLIETHSTMIYNPSSLYNVYDFQFAFKILPLSCALASMLCFFLKDKKQAAS